MATGISKLSWLGVATEATPGTPIATPTVLAPTKSSFKNQKKIAYEDDERGTRDAVYGARITTKMASGDIKGNWYNNSGGYFLYAFMGADTASQPNAAQDPTVWSHALTLANLPPTLTLFRAVSDVAVYQLSYVVVDKLSFKWTAEGKLVELDGNWQSHKGVKMGTPPTKPSVTDPTAFGGFAPTITVDSTQSLDIEEMTVTFTQKWDLFYASGNGADFTAAYPGERKAELDFTARFINTTSLYDKFDTDLTSHVNIVLVGDLISGTYNHQLTFDFPIVSWDDMDHQTSKALTTLKAKGTAMAGSADNSLFTATLQNTKNSYTV